MSTYPLPLFDLLRAAQCAYYVWAKPFLTDTQFDAWERKYQTKAGQLPVGSDSLNDYTIPERNLALYFIARAHD